ncbi:MAG: carboxypeptidase-like regulatory domain-containing protein [Gemmatimonadales bacterium]
MLRFAFAASVLLSTTALAQRDTTAIVRGTVTDSGGRPIESVELSATTIGRVVRTDSAGRFAITGLLPGRNRLLVRRLGWKAVDTSVVVAAKVPFQLHLVLARVAQDLDAVRIVSQDECPSKTLEGFDCRRRAGIGAFRDSAEIAAIRPVCVADITYGMEGLRRTPGSRGCSSFVPTTGWRCVRVLVDGVPGNPMPGRMTDYIGVEFYANSADVPEWYKMSAFAGARAAVPLHQDFKGGPFVYRTPAVGGTNCSLIVYWTHFATRADPSLDQSKATTIMMKARRDSLAHMLDSIRVAVDSSARKKP